MPGAAVLVLLGSPAFAMQGASTPRRVQVTTVGGVSYLGVGLGEIDSERAKALKLKEEYGVEVTNVEDESPAAKAGLKAGDVILEYNGQRVEGLDQFSRLVRETPIGRDVKLLVSRSGSNQTVVAKIGSKRGMRMIDSNTFALSLPPVRMPEIVIPDVPRGLMTWRSSMLGVEAESVEGQLATYFGVKEGVLVRSVSKGSAAEKAGIKAGDVIVKVDDTTVATPSSMTSTIRSLRSKKSFPVVLMRDHKETTVTVTLDDSGAALERRPFRVVRL